MTVEDASGSNLADTTFAHMNASTPAGLLEHTDDFDSWVSVTHVDGPSARDGSELCPQAEAPGLGSMLRGDLLGKPFVDVCARRISCSHVAF